MKGAKNNLMVSDIGLKESNHVSLHMQYYPHSNIPNLFLVWIKWTGYCFVR